MERKRAWAELEREQQEVKRDIKSLMKLEPASRAISDPALADRVTGQQQYFSQEKSAMKAASPAEHVRKQPDPVSQNKPSVVNDYNNTNSASAKKKEAAAQQSQKRQWLAPSNSNDDLT